MATPVLSPDAQAIINALAEQTTVLKSILDALLYSHSLSDDQLSQLNRIAKTGVVTNNPPWDRT